jgi:hypothetical protein
MSPMRSANRSAINLERYLPPAGWRTWGVRNKAAVVIAIQNGTLSRVDAYARYRLSEEELSQWEEAYDQDGVGGLQATRRISGTRQIRVLWPATQVAETNL